MQNNKLTKWMTEPLSDRPFLSVVIPCYNEESRLLPTIGAVVSTMCDLDIDWELIIVDDGSTDKTAEIAEAIPFENLRLLNLIENQGKGAAVRAGVRAARAPWVLFTDADNSTPIEEVADFLPDMLDGRTDIICGSRALPESTVEGKSGLRQFATKTLSTLVQLGLRLPVKDSQCGFKAMKTDVALRLLELQKLKGFSFDMELLYLAKNLGYRIAERPVHWVDAPGSKVEPFKEAIRFLGAIRLIRQEHGHLAPPTTINWGLSNLIGGVSA